MMWDIIKNMFVGQAGIQSYVDPAQILFGEGLACPALLSSLIDEGGSLNNVRMRSLEKQRFFRIFVRVVSCRERAEPSRPV